MLAAQEVISVHSPASFLNHSNSTECINDGGVLFVTFGAW